MKRQRIKLVNLPRTIVRQYPSTLYKDSRTGRTYTLETLQRLYGEKEQVKEKEVKPHWTNKYYGNE